VDEDNTSVTRILDVSERNALYKSTFYLLTYLYNAHLDASVDLDHTACEMCHKGC